MKQKPTKITMTMTPAEKAEVRAVAVILRGKAERQVKNGVVDLARAFNADPVIRARVKAWLEQ